VTKQADEQRAAVGTLGRLAVERPQLLTIIDTGVTGTAEVVVTIRLPTGDLDRAPRGLPLKDVEDFDVHIGQAFPYMLPRVTVRHDRFAGQPHVLVGTELCIYLDPAREWSPNLGIIGFLNRLWEWLADAAAARFDASTALYHPVGGVLHRTHGAPTVVVRQPIPPELINRGLLVAGLQVRTDYRLDLTGWHARPKNVEGPAPVILLPGPLVFGAGVTIHGLLMRIAHVGFPALHHVLAHLFRLALHVESGGSLYLVVGARNPAGPLPRDHHLLVARFAPSTTAELQSLASARFKKAGPLATFRPQDMPADERLEWCAVSDERQGIATRRDAARPTSWFVGKHVELWGLGGIGSWTAELLVRAGVRRLTLRDHGVVTSGLLVRQNYAETDVGLGKATALASRLRAISDDVELASHDMNVVALLAAGELPDCDLIIDATVNTTVAQLLQRCALRSEPHPALASVSLDVPTATLGLLAVAASDWKGGPHGVERQHALGILRSGDLEHFHVFWQDMATTRQVLPERGCSVPTFHGSTGDMMAIVGTSMDALARRLAASASGLELFATAHAPLPENVPRQVRTDALPPRHVTRGSRSVWVSDEARDQLMRVPEAHGDSRILVLGEHSDAADSVWIDDVVTMPSDGSTDEVDAINKRAAESSFGISRYIGDAIPCLPTSSDTKADAAARVLNQGGSLLLYMTVEDGGLTLEVSRVAQ
jgi:hypothetical protein